jgi:hypothetical protein
MNCSISARPFADKRSHSVSGSGSCGGGILRAVRGLVAGDAAIACPFTLVVMQILPGGVGALRGRERLPKN